jgi:alkanesulfonate monooxygenase SsuD/methylene tetrahydromethanopterin reductase-like flavin-dependent oxidoreductase (luciferase family)
VAHLIFGVNVPTSAKSGMDPVADALAAEQAGFDFISSSDHPEGKTTSLEVWTMLCWIAARTTRIRLATRVLGVPYRPPAMVAKMAATLELLANDRLILGLGGGAADEEFRAFGLRVPTPREKVDGLAEAVNIIRGLWTKTDFTYPGRLFQTSHAELEPKPQRQIPIWLGTFGPRALDVTGRLADGWIPSLAYAPPDRVGAMRRRVLAAAEAAGRKPDELTCVYNVQVRVDERATTQEHRISGSPDEVSARLVEFLRLGFNGLNFMPSGDDYREQVERLGREVVPAIRGQLAGTSANRAG